MRRWPVATLSAAMFLLAGCRAQKMATVLPACSGDSAMLRARVLDGSSFQPVAGMLLAIEVGGIYVSNPDTSKANLAYRLGARTGADGLFEMTLPCDLYGLHAYAPGFRYGSALAGAGQSVQMLAEPLLPQDQPPTIGQASLSASAVGTGEPVTIQVTAAKGTSGDPLSEEVLAVLPELGQSMALDPPGPGDQGLGFPDGVWRRTFAAPAAPGTYAYQLMATSEGCVVSNRLELSLTVR